MIKELVEKILDKKLNNPLPKDILSNLQFAGNDFVFYRLTDKASHEKLKSRLPSTFSGILILNQEVDDLRVESIVFDDEKFFQVQDALLDAYYPIDQEVQFVGITGTNGKTSTCWFFSQLLKQNQIDSLYLGTIGVFKNLEKISDDVITTTPSLIDLRRHVFHHLKKGIVILEMSSHALWQNRLRGVRLAAAGWTSFSQDHLDYHETLEDYFLAKMKIFSILEDKGALFVPGSQKELMEKIDHKKAVFTKNYFETKSVESGFLKARYNQDNFNIALSLIAFFKHSYQLDLEGLTPPPGRFELIERESRSFVIDYAHTPDALEKILRTIKEAYPKKTLWCIFGCGGNRDRLKRKEMGHIASQFSDKIIVTSDNPRDEEPEQIIDDICEGIEGEFFREVDRRCAIFKSLELSNPGDIILIAGKGHEEYQEIKGERLDFSDKKEVLNLGVHS